MTEPHGERDSESATLPERWAGYISTKAGSAWPVVFLGFALVFVFIGNVVSGVVFVFVAAL